MGVVSFLVALFFGFRGVANADELCDEGDTRYSAQADLSYTCEDGKWHEGPYGYTIDSPDLNGVICGQMILGETPIEIAERLHQGDARISQQQAGQKVWEALPECG